MKQEAEQPSSGNVFFFGIWTCIKAEGQYYWSRKWRVRGIYESTPHEDTENRQIATTKERMIKLWAYGLLGTLGLQYLTAGRFITGTLRFLYGVFMWAVSITALVTPQGSLSVNPAYITLVFLVCLFIPSVMDIISIVTGRFQDAFRNCIT